MKVLVADDDPDVRSTLGEYLKTQGLTVVEASNGLEALLEVKRERPAAVVLDLWMPRLGGVDALRRIRRFDPTIAIVVVTGDTNPAVHAQAAALGAQAILVKPIRFADLAAALRRGDGHAAAARASSAPAGIHTPGETAARILVVDDDREVRTTLVEFLTRRGYEVASAPDATAALSVLANGPPDIILLDIMLPLPGMSGADALPTIRRMAPEAVVIMVSGVTDEALAKRTLAQGAFDYLSKPIDGTYLIRSLEAAAAMKQLGL
jgi:DNA-binding response OmpR family regulator